MTTAKLGGKLKYPSAGVTSFQCSGLFTYDLLKLCLVIKDVCTWECVCARLCVSIEDCTNSRFLKNTQKYVQPNFWLGSWVTLCFYLGQPLLSFSFQPGCFLHCLNEIKPYFNPIPSNTRKLLLVSALTLISPKTFISIIDNLLHFITTYFVTRQYFWY